MGQGDVRHDLSTWTRLLISQLEFTASSGPPIRLPPQSDYPLVTSHRELVQIDIDYVLTKRN